MPYGPWSPTIAADERRRQLRRLAGIRATHVGSSHAVVEAPRLAEVDDSALEEAQRAFEQLPSLTRRRALSTLSIVTFGQPRCVGRPAA